MFIKSGTDFLRQFAKKVLGLFFGAVAVSDYIMSATKSQHGVFACYFLLSETDFSYKQIVFLGTVKIGKNY